MFAQQSLDTASAIEENRKGKQHAHSGLRSPLALLILACFAVPSLSPPAGSWRPFLKAGPQPSWRVFRYKVQNLLISRSRDQHFGLKEALREKAAGEENYWLAVYFHQVLQFHNLFRQLPEPVYFGVMVFHSELAPDFAGGKTWISAGATGEGDSGGILQWPPGGVGVKAACLSSQDPEEVDWRDPSQAGLPCPEGGTVAVKNVDWGGVEVRQKRSIVVLYSLASQLEFRRASILQPGRVDTVQEFTRQCSQGSFAGTTELAACIHEQLGMAAAIVVAPDSAHAVDPNDPHRLIPAKPEYSGLTSIMIPAGDILVFPSIFVMHHEGLLEGYLAVKIYVCPFWRA